MHKYSFTVLICKLYSVEEVDFIKFHRLISGECFLQGRSSPMDPGVVVKRFLASEDIRVQRGPEAGGAVGFLSSSRCFTACRPSLPYPAGFVVLNGYVSLFCVLLS